MNRKIPQRGAGQNAAELAGSGLALAVLGGGPRSADAPQVPGVHPRPAHSPLPWVEPLPAPRCLPQARSLTVTHRWSSGELSGGVSAGWTGCNFSHRALVLF